jgi:hypothetical protein
MTKNVIVFPGSGVGEDGVNAPPDSALDGSAIGDGFDDRSRSGPLEPRALVQALRYLGSEARNNGFVLSAHLILAAAEAVLDDATGGRPPEDRF